MKASYFRSSAHGLAFGGLTILAGCISAPPPPAAVVVQPAPVAVETISVPSSYVIVDGEYIGFAGNQYYYLAPGCVWVICDSARLAHFHHWENSHRDWRAHAIPNDRFRRDALGHEYPRPDDRRTARPGYGDPRARPTHVAPRTQPSHGSQTGRSDPHGQLNSPQSDAHSRTVRGGQPAVQQQAPSASRAQPSYAAPSKDAPKRPPKATKDADARQ